MADASWKTECTGVCQCSTLDQKSSLKEIFLIIITYNVWDSLVTNKLNSFKIILIESSLCSYCWEFSPQDQITANAK